MGSGKPTIVTFQERNLMSDPVDSRRTFLALTAAAPAVLALGSPASAQISDAIPAALPGEGRAAVGRAISLQADVADPAAVRALFDANEEAFGGVDVVVNNAGIMNVGPFAQMTDEAFDRMIATNVKGGFNVLREAARRTRDGGRIISLSSSIINAPPPGTAAYAATKAAQVHYSSVLSKELAGRDISVNAIAPGAVDTQLLRQHGEEALRGIPEQTPLGRLGQPEDIANVIALLCSRDGTWINGGNVFANGGLG